MQFDIDIRKTLRSGQRRFELGVQWRSDCQRLVILGPSGSGKSQTLKAIAGLMTPDSGHIRLGGRTLESIWRRRRDAWLICFRTTRCFRI